MIFSPPKKKMYELAGVIALAGIFYLIFPNVDAVILFSFGYIWNWTASNDVDAILQNRRYRLSSLKMVVWLQSAFLKPFAWAPEILKRFVRVLPAGCFWSLVIFVNESSMPWWATFVGSLVFEILQFEIGLFKKQKEVP